jgi:hypothetical protein
MKIYERYAISIEQLNSGCSHVGWVGGGRNG